jgi:hypothetical protein
MKLIFVPAICVGCLLAASGEAPKKILVTKTEHADLPTGGTIRFKNSTGELTIEGWDQPGVEITTTASTKIARGAHLLAGVKVSETREGNDLVITTGFPRHTRFLPRPSVGARDFDLEYNVKVPRKAKLIVDHDAGEVHLDHLTGDIHATMLQGEMTLRLPAESQYDIDAKSRIGDVISDFAGTARREHLGHTFMTSRPAPHSLYLRNGYGDIIILREYATSRASLDLTD